MKLFKWSFIAGLCLLFFIIIGFLILETKARRFLKDVKWPLQPDQSLGWASPPGPAVAISHIHPWQYKKTSFEMNSLGCADIEHPLAKPPGTFRIAVVGDSYVQSLQVDISLNFVRLLEKRLNNLGKENKDGIPRQFECINLGVSNYGLDQELLFFQAHGKTYAPDLVVHTIFPMNDYSDCHPELNYASNFPKPYFKLLADGRLTPQPSVTAQHLQSETEPIGILAHSMLFRLYRQAMPGVSRWLESAGLVKLPRPPFRYFPPWVNNYVINNPDRRWEQAREIGHLLIKNLAEEARALNAGYVAVYLPGPEILTMEFPDLAYPLYPVLKEAADCLDLQLLHQDWEPFCRKAGIDTVDLFSLLARDYQQNHKPHYFFPDGHFNEYGHQLVAELLAGRILAKPQNKQAQSAP